MNIQQQYKKEFPFFNIHKNAIYLDSSSTTQKPQCVIDTIEQFYRIQNANGGRGVYPLSTGIVNDVEAVRERIQDFIGAEYKEEIFFVAGATDAQEKLAHALMTWFQDGDEILFSPFDHRSFVLPWVQIQKCLLQFGIQIHLIPYKVKETGDADINDIISKISDRTTLINITHIHNIFGSKSDIDQLKKIAGERIFINVDAAQSVGHTVVDVQHMGADMLSFSSHKMFGSLGLGALYIRKDTSFYEHIKEFLEIGTQNYAGILSLGRAIEFIEEIGVQDIHLYLTDITQYAIQSLKKIPGLSFTKGIAHCPQKGGNGIISFQVDGVHSGDIAFHLAQKNIMVRAGYHCSMSPDVMDSVRVSMHIYTSKEDIDILVQEIQHFLS